ncbi:MAG: metallophosphoesterase family protein, partial [Candidatus Wildermuthbacteria bacterium]|nr:metallophosphoesterase family protein [Candidatus Wildermuthbacteria bacterium]
FKGEIYLVRGNLDQKIEAPDFKILEIDKIKIAFTHFPAEARKLAETKKLDFVFYGHTHKPWLEQIGRCILANPGNLAGMIYKASFAILDTKAKYLSLKILDSL